MQEIPGGKASNTLIPERKIETHLKHYATWNKHSKGLSGARELAGTEAEKKALMQASCMEGQTQEVKQSKCEASESKQIVEETVMSPKIT